MCICISNLQANESYPLLARQNLYNGCSLVVSSIFEMKNSFLTFYLKLLHYVNQPSGKVM